MRAASVKSGQRSTKGKCNLLIRYIVEALKRAKRPAGARGVQEACVLVFSLTAASAAQIS